MNDLTTTTEEEGFAAPAPLRTSVFDANRFKDVMAVAEVMAMSSLIPESLRFDVEINPETGEPISGKKKELSFDQIKANCFLICNWSAGVGMDPFAVAQGTSIVRGRLMFEGKIVHAALSSQLRVKLKPLYGKWDAVKAVTIVGAEPNGKDLAIRLYEEMPDGSIGRYIDGYVAGWETTRKGSPWLLMQDWRKLLVYRGSREWSRVFEPGVMLGVITTDEYDPSWDARDITPARQQSTGSDVIGRLKEARSKETAKPSAGFDQDRIDETTKSGAATAPAEEGKTVSNDKPSPGTGGASSTSPAGSASADAPKNDQQSQSDARPTAIHHEWLRAIAVCLWSATNYKGDVTILKDQRRGLGATYPVSEMPQALRDKVKSIMETCTHVCEGTVMPMVARKLIAGVAGMEINEFADKAASKNG